VHLLVLSSAPAAVPSALVVASSAPAAVSSVPVAASFVPVAAARESLRGKIADFLQKPILLNHFYLDYNNLYTISDSFP
jgi:hypothetical protein